MADWLTKIREWLELHTSWKTLGFAVAVIAVCAFFGGTVYEDWQAEHAGLALVDEAPSALDEKSSAPKEADATKSTSEVKVHVVGAVTTAGVYTLPADARVDDRCVPPAPLPMPICPSSIWHKSSLTGKKSPCQKWEKPRLLKPPPV